MQRLRRPRPVVEFHVLPAHPQDMSDVQENEVIQGFLA